MNSKLGTISPSQHPGSAISQPWFAIFALLLAAFAVLSLGGSAQRLTTSAPAEQFGKSLVSPSLQSLIRETSSSQAEILSRGEIAERRNALIPISRVALRPAHAFRSIRIGTPAYETAVKCLTQTVYYEAANEPVEGQRAVAQVVLNRVRHPAYPDTVCGVVYQGSNEAVCQFSFTCDGSLLRNPLPAQWAQARAVAVAALGGFVEKSVGSATNYHADYVLPRWAYTLGKVEQLGHHIFYRFKGTEGESAFLTARWGGKEVIPVIDYASLAKGLAGAEDQQPATRQLVPGLTVTPQITDRHAENDVGGRIDTTKAWRPSIPDPVLASRSYVQAIADQRKTEPIALGSDIAVP